MSSIFVSRFTRLMLLPRYLVGAGVVIGASYALLVASKLAPARHVRIARSPQHPPEFAKSRSRSLANPNGHIEFAETLAVTLDVASGSALSRMTDEQILARLVKGYFGGWVIAPERCILWALKADIAKFEQVPNPGPNIWSPARSLTDHALPPIHTRLIGGFLVLEKHIQTGSERSSYIDLGFGFNHSGSNFCGVDRISVTRDSNIGGDGDLNSMSSTKITIMYSALACNPSVNRLPLFSLALRFHSVYARVLFREGLAKVLQAS